MIIEASIAVGFFVFIVVIVWIAKKNIPEKARLK